MSETTYQGAAPLEEPRFSDLLRSLGEGTASDRVSVGSLIAGLGRRGHGALLIVLGAPNVLPLPVPGLSILAGLPLLFLTLQIAGGRPTPWVPDWLARRTIGAAEFRSAARAIAIRLARLERVVRPRWPVLTTGWPRRGLGLFSVLLAVTLFLPLPLGNALPGLSLALIGLALIERDAIVAMSAIVIGLVGLAVMSAASAAIVGAIVILARGTAVMTAPGQRSTRNGRDLAGTVCTLTPRWCSSSSSLCCSSSSGIRRKSRPFAARALALLLGLISSNDVLAAIANPAPATIGAMFVLSAALVRTGARRGGHAGEAACGGSAGNRDCGIHGGCRGGLRFHEQHARGHGAHPDRDRSRTRRCTLRDRACLSRYPIWSSSAAP